MPEKKRLSDLKLLKLSKLDTDDLNIAQHKLNQYSEDLDKLINQPYVNKHISWFTYFTITLGILLILLYLFCRRRRSTRISIMAPDNQPPPTPMPSRTSRTSLSRFIPRRRLSVHT
ncbi:hypothetical protein JTB14_020906 [Gonioctena quinquepunctata]|nr:hypothetical protein JTB14_020906 [Gonioctena quinquepunctata]